MTIMHTGYDVWCDACSEPLGATIQGFDTKRLAWAEARRHGWGAEYVMGKKKHYCENCWKSRQKRRH